MREPYLGTGSTLELGFDVPGQRGFAVLVKNHIVAHGVDVLRVNEEAVHVKEACSDFWETDGSRLARGYENHQFPQWQITGAHVLILACCHCSIGLAR